MKTYKAVFNEAESEGVFSISLVNTPAMEGLFVALNKQDKQIQLKEIDKEQRILIGLVLEPEKLIYRFNEKTKEEFNIVFDAETIKNLSYNFFKKGNQKNSTIEHENKIDGVTFVESWIVEDSDKDKSNAYGLSYPKGSWIATMKIDSNDIWNNYVKTGKVQGFSVDAMLDLQEVNLKSNINMSKVEKPFIEQLKDALGLSKTEVSEVAEIEVKLGSIPLTDEDVTIMYEGETLEVGAELFIEAEDQRIAVPEGEHKTEEGILVVDASSMLVEIKPLEAVEEEAPVEEELNTEAPASAPSQESDLKETIKSILVKYHEQTQETLNGFKTELSSVVEENKNLKLEVLELSKQPSVKPVGRTEQKATTKKGRILQNLNK